MKLSKSQINKLGKQIRKQEKPVSDDLLEQLQEYRISHKSALSKVFEVVCEKSNKIRTASIVTYRIKRLDSIIRKLDRLSNRPLGNMNDIGGCRCILKNDTQVYKLRDQLLRSFTLKEENDHIKAPLPSGYKSLHLYLEVPNESNIIEVQIRNQADHNWATLVEISDVIFDSRLKEYNENKTLLRFHYLLSKKRELNLDEMSEIASTIKKYRYVDHLSNVFTRNNTLVRKQWMTITTQNNFKFFLIESNKNSVPIIKSFKTFSEAEKAYFDTYLLKSNSNILLTNLPNPNYHKISVAYSNYLLTTHEFFQECFFMLRKLIKKSLLSGEINSSIRFFNLYYQITFNHLKNTITDIQQSVVYKKNKSSNRKKSKQEIAWDKTIEKNFNQAHWEMISLIKIINNSYGELSLKKLFIIISFKAIEIKYIRKLNKLVDSDN